MEKEQQLARELEERLRVRMWYIAYYLLSFILHTIYSHSTIRQRKRNTSTNFQW